MEKSISNGAAGSLPLEPLVVYQWFTGCILYSAALVHKHPFGSKLAEFATGQDAGR